MPAPPPPNAIRAVIGFIAGPAIFFGVLVGLQATLNITNALTGFSLPDLGIYVIPLDFAESLGLGIENLTRGWFYEDEFWFMTFMFVCAFGFLWGSGAMYDFEKAKAQKDAKDNQLMLTSERGIPVDPDRAPDFEDNPIVPLVGAFPAIGISIAVLVLTAAVMFAVPALGIIPTQTQTTNDAAERSEFSDDITFNFVGLIEFEGSQAQLFVIFALIVVGSTVGLSLGLAFIFYMLNRQVTIAVDSEPDPEAGEQFWPIRFFLQITGFFTQWGVDILNGVSAVLRPRNSQ